MDALRFAIDELTGFWEWPVLLNDDWSQWTEDPCAVLFGETRSGENGDATLRQISEFLQSRDWPHLTSFRVGKSSILILASCYSREQSWLLAGEINRHLKQNPPPDTSASHSPLTWGITLCETEDWILPRALHAAVAPVERALRERRFGSINEAPAGWAIGGREDFWVCSRRDALTNLKSWDHTVALCPRYGDEPMAILLGDVDHCQTFNELYGHGMGDVLLQMLAHVLRRFESNQVAVFRPGGDEFLVWVCGHSLERAKQLAEQINAQIRALHIPVPHSDASISNIALTWAVIATTPRNLDMETLRSRADDLLDYTKCEQRGSVSAQYL